MLRKVAREFQSYERFMDEIDILEQPISLEHQNKQIEWRLSQEGEGKKNSLKEDDSGENIYYLAPSSSTSISLPPNQSPFDFSPFDKPIKIGSRRHSSTPDDLCQISCDGQIDPFYSTTLRLQKEILNNGGVEVSLSASELLANVNFVEISNQIWIAGWNQTSFTIHGIFHIGDVVVAIDDFPVLNAKQLEMALKVSRDAQTCTLRLRRVPLAKALVVVRQFDGGDIGVTFENGSNKVLEINKYGPLACAGLPLTAQRFITESKRKCRWGPMRIMMPDRENLNIDQLNVPWTVTEINHRPLDLFYQNNEAKILVGSLGTQISLVLQPSDFISLLCKKLKKKKTLF